MYKWRISYKGLVCESQNANFHDLVDRMTYHSNGNKIRDFYINGHHMNEEFGLWIINNKIVHDDGSDFVPMNKWYAILAVPGEHSEPDESEDDE